MNPAGPIPTINEAPHLREALEHPVVKRRITEYLGGSTPDDATCLFLGRLDSRNPARFDRFPVSALPSLMLDSCELARSLADRDSMLVHLDIEYVNFDDPAAAFIDPERTFLLQEPLVKAIETRLLGYGIPFLHLVTGQGHHFVWKIHKTGATARAIIDLNIRTDPAAEPLFPHLALVMEFLAHQLKKEAAPACEVPVEITARHVGPGPNGQREMLSIDISEYGDPLDSRMIRIPYTLYRKPWISGLIERLGISDSVPEFFALPLYEMDVFQLISLRHLPGPIIDLARRAGVSIPTAEDGTRRLLDAYRDSGLLDFHRKFHSTTHSDCPELDPRTGNSLPPCLRHVFVHPNDLLLKPSGMQLATRCLLAAGWQPRHIAGLISIIFQDSSYDWGHQWDHYDPRLRAEFYVRLFAGEIDQRIDGGVDFNCVSQQEKHFCWNPSACSLQPLHSRLYPKS